MQREVPEEINIAACKLAKKYNVLTVLDIGGADVPLTDELLSLLDIISPNKTELKRITGKEIDTDNEKELIPVIEELREKSKNKNLEILMKLGSKGAMYIDKNNFITKQNSFKFDDMQIVDTTGAGNLFYIE
jgi:ribokinase